MTRSRIGATIFVMLVLAACGESASAPPDARPAADAPPPPPAFTAEPTVAANDDVPLAPLLRFTTDVPTSAEVAIADGARSFTLAFPAPAREHEHALLGLRAGRTHAITVHLTAAGGGRADAAPLAFVTAPLPADFPPIRVLVNDTAAREPGVTLFNLAATPDRGVFYQVILDADAEVVWYYANRMQMGDVRRVPGGNILYNDRGYGIVEIDMRGRVVRRWHAAGTGAAAPPGAIAVATDSFHHDVSMLPSGNLLALGSELRHFASYPASETDASAPPAAADVIGDLVVEVRPDGMLAKSWSMLDALDPQRIGYGSLAGFWNVHYAGVAAPTRDWSHGNAVVYDERSDAFVVSLRAQDAVVKVRRATGELVWILGTHDNWRAPWSDKLLAPLPGLEWQYHQHSAKVLPDGHVMLYDNGNFRATPPAARRPARENYSRALELAVDEATMTVAQVWSYGGPAGELFYSPYICDADLLPVTGNVLITDGGRVVDPDGVPADGPEGNHVWARLLEVTHTTPSHKVWEVQIGDPSPATSGWRIYRSQRLPSVAP